MLVEGSSLRDELLAALPSLRAFAISFTNNRDRADDLVQETILRNLFHSDYRKRKHEVEDADGAYAARLKTHPDQQSHLDFEDFRTALATLPRDQREALLFIGAHGLSYEEAAQVCNVAVGTVKSRVNRARLKLAYLLDLTSEAELGPDNVTKAALAAD